MARAPAAVRALRPRQWTKNLAVFAPLVFARAIFVPGAALAATLTFLAFCFLASGLYVVNDWVDQTQDRLHPEKKSRPIAAGEIGPWGAGALVAGCWVAGGALAGLAGPNVVPTALAYLVVELAYTFWLKRYVIVDALVIATGFVLRVYAGAEAVHVPVSNWLFLCALLLALFLALAKRRNELDSLEHAAHGHRPALADYSLALLDQMLTVVAASCIVAYALYTVAPDTVEKVGSDRMKFSLPFVVYGIFRYLYLIHRKGAGGSPERVLLSDVPTLVNLGLYLSTVGWVLFGHQP
ncbi:MAG TPA: decaprenyl-phosphate phosphoribosyltransferase [Myxococcaceae bacterium]|nr:decaprenyl-phosphate phosphoribosyltransferase [Myxococcaceae bacterium]